MTQTNSTLYASALSFLRGEAADSSAWDELEASAELSSEAALVVTLELVASLDDCDLLGAVAGGPLWTLLQNASPKVVARLDDELTRGVALSRCFAIERYRENVFDLQSILSCITGCETPPRSLRPLAAEQVVRKAVQEAGTSSCVRISNPFAQVRLTPEIAAGVDARWATLMRALDARHDDAETLASELEDLLSNYEVRLLPRAVRQAFTSPQFRCSLSFTTLLALSEGTIDMLLAVMRSVTDKEVLPP